MPLDVGYYLSVYRRGEMRTLRDEMSLAADLSEAAGVPVDLRDLAAADRARAGVGRR